MLQILHLLDNSSTLILTWGNFNSGEKFLVVFLVNATQKEEESYWLSNPEKKRIRDAPVWHSSILSGFMKRRGGTFYMGTEQQDKEQ